jgi:signal transduction histidine kinase
MASTLYNYLKEIWSIELTYKRSVAVLIVTLILIFYSTWGAILSWEHPEFYDGFLLRLLPIFPFALLVYFDISRYIPIFSNKIIILFLTVAVSFNFQYLIIHNNFNEYYLVGFLVMIGMATSAFNSLSHIIFFAASSFFWYFYALKTQEKLDPRLSFWAGMLLTMIVGSFGYFIARMSLLLERKNNLALLNDQLKELVTTQEKLLEKEAQTIHASKLASLSEMAAGVAHEINNPLVIIMGQAGMLIRSLEGNTLEKERGLMLAQKIIETSERISKIVKALIFLTTVDTSANQQNSSVHQTLKIVTDVSLEKMKSLGITFSIQEPQQEDIILNCSSVDLTKVLVSLVFNSIDAVKNTEKPWIELQIDKNKYKDGISETQIRVTDSGLGIPVHIIEKIFNPFFTTKPTGQGI